MTWHTTSVKCFISVKDRHKLGTKIDEPATVEEALKVGGLDWTVSMQPLALAGEHQSAVAQRHPRRQRL